MSNYKEIRRLGCCDMRALCIKHDWCTHMDNDEYRVLLDRAECDNLTTEDIVWLANTICNASDIPGGMRMRDEFFEFVAFEILDACSTVLVKKN